MIRFILKLFHQRKERAAHSFDLEEKRTALRRDLAAIQEKAAALADEMKSLRTLMALPPPPGTPSKGMCRRVIRQAQKKKEKAETSDADKKHLGKMIHDCSRKIGPVYFVITMLCDNQCCEELMELVLEMYREHRDSDYGEREDCLDGIVRDAGAPDTPSKEMRFRVIGQAVKKKKKAETSDADKELLDKMIYDFYYCEGRSGPASATITTLCDNQCCEELMELVLEIYREHFYSGNE
eukprot:CAMPEP_0178547484 /NCGR_PEP_ID=MMETSP0697-20121206/4703_1 /TAXON_ID=265572 /ORGANISM="Extubocellulus spinifer, Strain CCMP396" /LENGTH=237 /DNA_ID=CAMNT_0020180127 /DNA_START=690 /DNA_END=1403 /DNA_ORIENTATION=-